MHEKGGLGDGVLHLVDGSDHLRGDGEVLLGLGQGVGQGAGDVGKAGYYWSSLGGLTVKCYTRY